MGEILAHVNGVRSRADGCHSNRQRHCVSDYAEQMCLASLKYSNGRSS